MAQQKRQSIGTGRDGRKDILFLLCGLLVGILFFTSVPTAWATPGQGPPHQTIPTPVKPPGPGKPHPETPLPPTPGIPGGPCEFRLGPGDGMFNLGLPNAGCIQINVRALSRPLFFRLTPIPPDSAPPLQPGYKRTTVAYILQIWDTLTGQPATNIVPDYTHVICYNDADLAIANGDPHRFVIAYYDDGRREWVELVPTIIDVPNRHALGNANHASTWALLVKDITISPAPETLPETGVRSGAFPLAAVGLGLVLLSLGGGLVYWARKKRDAAHPGPWWKR
jgi:LPXTG-motif cell wall-anchored protein